MLWAWPWLRRIVGVNLDRSVPIGVGKETSDASEVHDVEEEFALLLTDSRASTYNLLELRHGVDVLVEHNQFHHLAIDSS